MLLRLSAISLSIDRLGFGWQDFRWGSTCLSGYILWPANLFHWLFTVAKWVFVFFAATSRWRALFITWQSTCHHVSLSHRPQYFFPPLCDFYFAHLIVPPIYLWRCPSGPFPHFSQSWHSPQEQQFSWFLHLLCMVSTSKMGIVVWLIITFAFTPSPLLGQFWP